MTDEVDAPDVREWMHGTLTEAPPGLDVAAVMRDGRHRRQRSRISIVAVAAAAVVGLGVLTPTVLSTIRSGPSPAPATNSSRATTCQAFDLAIAVGRTEGTAGTMYHSVRLTNATSLTCALDRWVQWRWSRGGSAKTTLELTSTFSGPSTLLRPRQTASLTIAVPDPANFSRGCRARQPTKLEVSIPSDAPVPTALPWRGEICTGRNGQPVAEGYQLH